MIDLKDIKATIGQFVFETQSTDIYKFIQWIECKEELRDRLEKEMRKK